MLCDSSVTTESFASVWFVPLVSIPLPYLTRIMVSIGSVFLVAMLCVMVSAVKPSDSAGWPFYHFPGAYAMAEKGKLRLPERRASWFRWPMNTAAVQKMRLLMRPRVRSKDQAIAPPLLHKWRWWRDSDRVWFDHFAVAIWNLMDWMGTVFLPIDALLGCHGLPSLQCVY